MSLNDSNRINYLDGLRGFALVGVTFAHMFEQYLGNIPGPLLMSTLNSSLLDTIIYGIYRIAIVGKFYLIFSLLFGISFSLLLDKPLKSKSMTTKTFIWRLLLLFLIGFFHQLFYRGDILMIYSLLGLLLIFVKRLSIKELLMIIGLIFFGIPKIITFLILPEGSGFLGLPGIEINSQNYSTYVSTLQNGSITEIFLINFKSGFLSVLEAQFGIIGRGYSTFMMFIIGLIIGRLELISKVKQNLEALKITLKKSVVLFLISIVSMGIISFLFKPDMALTSFSEIILLIFYDLFNLSVCFIYICLFLLYFQSNSFLESYGRMALTNYILQALIGTFLFYGFGIGLLGSVSYVEILFFSTAIIFTLLIFSFFWMKYFYFGPLEWCWRCLTYRKVYPLKKKLLSKERVDAK